MRDLPSLARFCWTTALAVVWTAVPVSASATSDGRIDAQERQQILDLLRDSESGFLALLAGVSDAQWSWKPSPDRWSVGECAEHIVRSNEALLAAAKQALAGEMNPEWEAKTKGKTEILLSVMPNRNPGGAGGARAPQEIRPTGGLSRRELVERFAALYAEARSLVGESDAPWKAHTAPHPFPIFDPLSAYQWALYVPLHTTRHSKQMIEVMETEGYPEN
ncbi:MAG: DinB family protein [Acidobacteriota bacterium]